MIRFVAFAATYTPIATHPHPEVSPMNRMQIAFALRTLLVCVGQTVKPIPTNAKLTAKVLGRELPENVVKEARETRRVTFPVTLTTADITGYAYLV